MNKIQANYTIYYYIYINLYAPVINLCFYWEYIFTQKIQEFIILLIYRIVSYFILTQFRIDGVY